MRRSSPRRRRSRRAPASFPIVIAIAVVLTSALGASAGTVEDDPSIDVDKTCASGTTPVGGTISYRIRVTNTGGETLTDLVVDDPLLGGDLGGFPNGLAVGSSAQVHLTYTVRPDDPDPLRNTVSVSAVGAGTQQIVSDSATCSSEIEHSPGIRVTKECPDGVATPGQEISYRITVENTGDETLHDVTVRDPLLGGVLAGFGSSLAVGESQTERVDYTVQPGDPDPLVNTVTAGASGAVSGEGVADESTCSSGVAHGEPVVDVAKKCPISAALGDHVSFRIRVRNTGTEPLEGVVVIDELVGGTLSEFPSTIAPGVSVTRHLPYSIPRVDAPAPLINEVSVSAHGAFTAQAVSDTASCDTTLVGGGDENNPGGPRGEGDDRPTVRAGDTAFTGSDAVELSVLGLLLALAGSGALLVARRRSRNSRGAVTPAKP
ncbi:MAG: hypothetical protein WEA10_07755 [Actinomycetota bacterium]